MILFVVGAADAYIEESYFSPGRNLCVNWGT